MTDRLSVPQGCLILTARGLGVMVVLFLLCLALKGVLVGLSGPWARLWM